jgi:hypothetical protein
MAQWHLTLARYTVAVHFLFIHIFVSYFCFNCRGCLVSDEELQDIYDWWVEKGVRDWGNGYLCR